MYHSKFSLISPLELESIGIIDSNFFKYFLLSLSESKFLEENCISSLISSKIKIELKKCCPYEIHFAESISSSSLYALRSRTS